jgi:hypothetical protein
MTAADSSVDSAGRAPVHLWIVGVLALLWNLVGVWDYLATQLGVEAYLENFPEEVMAFVEAMPAWATAMWAFGVWGAFVGTILLLLRRGCAVWAYAVSIAGLFFSTIYSYVLSNGSELMGTGGVVMNVAIWIIAVFLLAYSYTMKKKGFLR